MVARGAAPAFGQVTSRSEAQSCTMLRENLTRILQGQACTISFERTFFAAYNLKVHHRNAEKVKSILHDVLVHAASTTSCATWNEFRHLLSMISDCVMCIGHSPSPRQSSHTFVSSLGHQIWHYPVRRAWRKWKKIVWNVVVPFIIRRQLLLTWNMHAYAPGEHGYHATKDHWWRVARMQ